MKDFGLIVNQPLVATYNNKRVYDSGIPGIGYTLGAEPLGYTQASGCLSNPIKWIDGTNTLNGDTNSILICSGPSDSSSRRRANAHVYLEFYKTGEINFIDSTLPVGFATMDIDDVATKIPITVALNFKRKQCYYLGSPLVTVPMGAIAKKDFKGINSSPSALLRKSFYFRLNCDKGAAVSMKIDGSAVDPSNGILALESTADSATGIGVQILEGNTNSYKPFPINVDKVMGTFSDYTQFNFQAQYIQTEKTINPGIANAVATFTFTYQ
jgi:type 1 fimbria pilin